tara:strand:+ start:93 stop:623 length:531 start_codon:yes stop_codon:yes gene_type:complete
MPTTEKIESVERLKETISESRSIVLADFSGIDVAAVTELRNKLREASVTYEVVKNRLAKRAIEDAGIDGLSDYLTGPTAMAFAVEDPLAPAQVLQKFIDDGGKIAIKSGLLDGEVMTPDQVKALALLPSREELLATTVGTIQGPLAGLVRVLNGLLSNMVGVVAAIEEKARTEGGE